MKVLYIVLCLVGTVLPLQVFVRWILDNGFSLSRFFEEISASKLGLFAWYDVLIAAICLIVFILYEGRRLAMRRLWLPILATCLVGVSLGLPLFLLLREMKCQGSSCEADASRPSGS